MLIDSLKQLSGTAAALSNAAKTAKTQTVEQNQSQTGASRSSTLQQQLDTLSQWSINADVSRQLAKNQQAEQQIRQLYQQLEQLKKQLDLPQSTGQKQQLSQQLQQMEQQLKLKSSAVTPALQLSSQPVTASQWQLNSKIDLLSPRKQPEVLTISLSNSQNIQQKVQLSFPAGQSAEANLQMMQQEFAKLQITLDQQGPVLLFSAAAGQSHLLSQAWQMQGEGIRVAAGNPVQVRLQKPEGQLNILAQQAQQMESQQAYQAELNQVQQKLQQMLRQVQSERQVLVAKLNALRMAGNQQSAEQVSVVSQELKVQMQQGAASSLSAIMAQGNVTRSLVEFALAD